MGFPKEEIGSGYGDGRRRRYPVALVKEFEGIWSLQHDFPTMGVLEIVKLVLMGSDEALVVAGEILDPKDPGKPMRSPFGPGEPLQGLRIPRWFFGTDVRHGDLVPPFAEWRPGETVRLTTEGDIQAGAIVCRRKGSS